MIFGFGDIIIKHLSSVEQSIGCKFFVCFFLRISSVIHTNTLTKLNHKKWGFYPFLFNNRFEEDKNTVVLDYPRKIKDFWTGIPTDIDAAFQYRDGKLLRKT